MKSQNYTTKFRKQGVSHFVYFVNFCHNYTSYFLNIEFSYGSLLTLAVYKCVSVHMFVTSFTFFRNELAKHWNRDKLYPGAYRICENPKFTLLEPQASASSFM